MRLFVAIKVPPSIHPSISRAAAHLHERMGVRILPSTDWHLTLRFIGEVNEETAGKIAEALGGVRFSPFGMHLFGAGAYPNTDFPRAIFIGGESEGAEKLAGDIESALSPFPLQKEKFSVHMTLARSKGAGDIDDFLKNTGEVGQFEAASFFLMKSTLLPQGASYEVLREYRAQA